MSRGRRGGVPSLRGQLTDEVTRLEVNVNRKNAFPFSSFPVFLHFNEFNQLILSPGERREGEKASERGKKEKKDFFPARRIDVLVM